MPIASGCPGVSQTLTVAQSPRGAAAAEGGAGGGEQRGERCEGGANASHA
jgi:hypothetical protein